MNIAETNDTIAELRELIHAVDAQKKRGPVEEDTVCKVRKTLVKLRRCHAKLRAAEKDEQREVAKVAKQLEAARSAFENAEFVESQCQFLVEKFNSAQCPDLDQIASSLPSPEEYTRLHSGDSDFVSFESDPHQFTLNLLSSELVDRERLSEEIVLAKKNQELVQSEILQRTNFLASLTPRLTELNKSMEGLRKLFGVLPEKLDNMNLLVENKELLLLATKFHPYSRVIIENENSVRIEISIPDLPPNHPPPVITCTVNNNQISFDWTPFCPNIEKESILENPQVVAEIKKNFALSAWNRYEESMLQQTPHHANLVSLLPNVPTECQLSRFEKKSNAFTGTIKVKSIQIDFEIFSNQIRIVKKEFVSSNPGIGQFVDLELAQAANDTRWDPTAKFPLSQIIVALMSIMRS